jgi:transcriptional regulator with XRE-family HTH domain
MTEQPQASVTARRMMLGARLRRLREERGISRAEAGYTIRASESKMSRLELGKVSFKERDVADLLVLYGVADPGQRDSVLGLLREANRPAWWREYEDVLPDWFQDYIGLEQAAERIRTYETHFVPGLLQTDDYSRAVIVSGLPTPTPVEADRAVALRATRKQLLTRAGAPHVWAVLDEAALRRPVGPDQVRVDQLEHLLKLADLSHVTLQVLPLTGLVHTSGSGAFTMLRFSEPDLPDVVYVENLLSALYLDKPDHVSRYTEVMDRLCVESLSPVATSALIADLLAESRSGR